MRIGLDGRNFVLAQGTGIATYARCLAGESSEWLLDAPPGAPRGGGRVLRYRRAFLARWRPLHTRKEGGVRIADDAFRMAQVHFDIWRRLLVLEGAALPDLMHWTSPLPLRMAGVPNLYTIHDTIPLDHPSSTDPRRFLRILQAIAAVADHVVTPSDAARRDLLRWVPGLAERVSVVPTAVAPSPPSTAERDAALGALGLLSGAYYLFAGIIEPRKNVAALLRAFLASGSRRCLVLAGPDGWQAGAQLAPFAAAIEAGRIRRVGYLPRDALIALMQGARALLFPSRAEGFGLPIIEAMALSTPVLTSRGGATEEAAGGAALLVDPNDLAALQAGIASLDQDERLCRDLAARGRVHATQFSPERQTARMSALYHEVLAATSISSVRAQVM